MDAFSALGILGFIFGLAALSKVKKLEQRLIDQEVLKDELKPDQ